MAMADNDQETERKIAYQKEAEKWVRKQLIPALRILATSPTRNHADVHDIESTQAIPTPLGQTLEFENSWPVPDAITSLTIEFIYPPGETPNSVPISYSIRLEVSAQGVTGHTELAVQGEIKHLKSPQTHTDILEWDRDKINDDFIRAMCND